MDESTPDDEMGATSDYNSACNRVGASTVEGSGLAESVAIPPSRALDRYLIFSNTIQIFYDFSR
ncbi:hypothetical protein FQA18_09220 [Haloferax volcanii]|uniref:Uncharacterized protein n=1 Tax=Haloferax volcanii TaxID=2246 RepID=A0A558GAZ8_HALVO|nr:hypothetical protein FQA18_09220 [Haloferax volcanii]